METLSWVVIITALPLFAVFLYISYKLGYYNGYNAGYVKGGRKVLNEWKNYMGIGDK